MKEGDKVRVVDDAGMDAVVGTEGCLVVFRNFRGEPDSDVSYPFSVQVGDEKYGPYTADEIELVEP
jgi:hypothetical protein